MIFYFKKSETKLPLSLSLRNFMYSRREKLLIYVVACEKSVWLLGLITRILLKYFVLLLTSYYFISYMIGLYYKFSYNLN